jgi:peptidyl-prolyl cis-trans isomerase SurA
MLFTCFSLRAAHYVLLVLFRFFSSYALPSMLRTLALWTLASAAGLLGLTACSSSAPAVSPSSSGSLVVARYADTSITLDQFERRYAASEGGYAAARDDSAAAYRGFLDRLLGFRLKVLAARRAGMDTLASVRQEADAYRQQMAPAALQREEVLEPIIQTLYERQKQEVDVSHVLIRVAPDAPPPDTLAAYREAQALRDSVRAGMRFATVAQRYSEDPSAQQEERPGYQGRLGYVSAGQLVEPFEETMYTVPEDSVSGVFRTRFGYHILKVHDRREREYPVKLSHLMIVPDGSTAADTAAARAQIDSLRAELVQGARFEAIARAHSDDQRSARQGGDLGFIDPNAKMPTSFSSAIDTLQQQGVGTLSEVFASAFGFHLLKLVDQKEPPPYEEAYDNLKQRVSRMPRVEKRKAALARSIRQETGTRVDTAALRAVLPVASLDSTARPLFSLADSAAATAVATLGDSTYALGALRTYVRQNRLGGASVAEALDQFLNAQALDYAAARLEQRDPEFASLMREYREGLLLFQYMQDSVWTVAQQDTAALRATYNAHPGRYRFPPRVRTLVFRSPVDSLLRPYVHSYTQERTPLADVVAQATADSVVQVDTVLVPPAADSLYQPVLSASDGTALGPLTNRSGPLWMVRDTRLPARPQTFQEARSAVLRDYQDAYEKAVTERLRERFGATTYPERLQAAFQGTASPPVADGS